MRRFETHGENVYDIGDAESRLLFLEGGSCQ